MKKEKKGFTLIEIIIATSVVVVSIFGVYALIGEQSKIFQKNQEMFEASLLFQPALACIKQINQPSDSGYINFGNDFTECIIVSTSSQITINDKVYSVYYSDKTATGVTIEIEGEFTGKMSHSFELTL